MKGLLLGVGVLLFANFAHAITVSPTILTLNVDRENSARIVVTNNSTEKLALEANIYKLNFLRSGELKSKQRENNSFLVFPLAAMLQPGQKQVFRLQWLDTPSLTQSQSYFVRFSQINLTQPESLNGGLQPNIRFQIHYNAVVHVFSEQLQPNVIMQVLHDGKVVLENRGDRFSYTNQIHFVNSGSITPEGLRMAIGEHFIPPHSKLELSPAIPLPVGEYYGQEH